MEKVFKYVVKETNTGMVEDRFIIGRNELSNYKDAIKPYEDGENWVVQKCEDRGKYVGV